MSCEILCARRLAALPPPAAARPRRFAYLTPLNRRGAWAQPEYGSASWPIALGGEFFPYEAPDLAPLEDYDVLLLHTSMALYGHVARVLEAFPHKTTVLVLTCDAMYIDPQGFFPGFATPLKALLDRASLAISQTEETAFFQAMTRTPVAYLPLPVPLEALRAAASGLRPTASVLLGSGFRAKKNGLASALAFKRLRERHGALTGLVFASDPEAERRAYAAWGIEGVEVRPIVPQPDYWRAAAECSLALHLDYRRTIGRFSAECAALGIPCISTASATMQRACFPALIVPPWDVLGAASLADRLLADGDFRRRVLARAADALEPIALAALAARLRAILDSFGL